MRAVLEEQSSGLEQLLRIQVLPVFVQYHVPELIARFKAQYPQIRVQIMETEKRQLEQNLEDGKCDVIYTREMVDEEEEQLRNRNGKTYDEKLTVAYDRFVAVLPENDPLAERTEISLRELEDRSFLLLDEKTELFSKAQKLCRRAGFEPNVAYQGVRIDTILAMTANGLGVSLLMDQTIPEKKEDGIIKIGENVYFNNFCSINSLCSIEIGDDCIFGENVRVYDHNHKFSKKTEKIMKQGYSKGPIKIGSDCWIGSNVTILKGVNIGDNVIIGAGSIIDKDIPSNFIVKPERNLVKEERI